MLYNYDISTKEIEMRMKKLLLSIKNFFIRENIITLKVNNSFGLEVGDKIIFIDAKKGGRIKKIKEKESDKSCRITSQLGGVNE